MHARPACAAGMVYVALTCHKAPGASCARSFCRRAPLWPPQGRTHHDQLSRIRRKPRARRNTGGGGDCVELPQAVRARGDCTRGAGAGGGSGHGDMEQSTKPPQLICPCAPHRQHDAGVIARATACSWIRSEMHGMRSGFVGGNRAHRRGALVPRSGRALCTTRVRRAARGDAPLVNRRSRRG